MDDWIALFGIWMAEGWVDVYHRSSGRVDRRVSLCVVKERERSFLKYALKKLCLHYCESTDKTKFFINDKSLIIIFIEIKALGDFQGQGLSCVSYKFRSVFRLFGRLWCHGGGFDNGCFSSLCLLGI